MWQPCFSDPFSIFPQKTMPKVFFSRFFVRNRDRDKAFATLFYRYQAPKAGIDMLISSRIKVNVAEWEHAMSDARAWVMHSRELCSLHLRLYLIEAAIADSVKTGGFSRNELKERIRSITDAGAGTSRKEEAASGRSRTEGIREYLDCFCREIADGTRLTANRRYSPGTVKSWLCFKKVYDSFDPEHIYNWHDIDRKFVSRFVIFLEDSGYMTKSINKYLVIFRCLVRNACKDGLHGNDKALQFFVKIKEDECEKAATVYLKPSELDALYNMKLKGKKAEVRDVFLVGCYTCQRVSDYTSISPDSFMTTRAGTEIIRFFQKKTRREVKVPIMDPRLKEICGRYGHRIPPVNDVILNRYIKRILHELSVTVPSLSQKTHTRLSLRQLSMERRGSLQVERNPRGEAMMPRWACVTSHTARRTGITLMYASHKYSIVQMMHVSGHRTQKTFLDYIKLSADEIADDIAGMADKSGGQRIF